jgi:hypothetical protein
MNTKRAIVFLAWGDSFIQEVYDCIGKSQLPEYDILLITDQETKVDSDRLHIIRVNFKTEWLLRKTEMIDFLPTEYSSFLFLDSDIRVIEDISLGFEMAEKYGIAISPASHYSLDYFWGYDKVMVKERMPCLGQLQFNTGVIFFNLSDRVRAVFERWRDLGIRYKDEYDVDQPHFSLAMEQLDFNPYCLSLSYNYRGFGDTISGIVRIWHSHDPMPEDINEFETPWPARRVYKAKVYPPPSEIRSPFQRMKSKLAAVFKGTSSQRT